jgi:UDP-glucose 4-epimerase
VKNILVTGGAGFIGSNLCEFLLTVNCRIIIVDNLSTGKLENFYDISSKVEFHQCDVETFNFDNLPTIDAVVHLAAQASVPISISDFEQSSISNMTGTIRVVDYCRRNNIPLVYASSSAIYGGLSLGDDQCEEIDLITPYATDKYAMELYTKTANRLYQLSSIGLRFFNVYGPRQDPDSPYSGVISKFIDSILANECITIYGGHQTRDFVYVKDVVKAIFQAIILVTSKNLCLQTNILTGKSNSIEKLANMLMEKIGNNVDKIYQGLPIGDPEQSNGTTQKMIDLLNINPANMTPLEVGLTETISFSRD